MRLLCGVRRHVSRLKDAARPSCRPSWSPGGEAPLWLSLPRQRRPCEGPRRGSCRSVGGRSGGAPGDHRLETGEAQMQKGRLCFGKRSRPSQTFGPVRELLVPGGPCSSSFPLGMIALKTIALGTALAPSLKTHRSTGFDGWRIRRTIKGGDGKRGNQGGGRQGDRSSRGDGGGKTHHGRGSGRGRGDGLRRGTPTEGPTRRERRG